MESNRIQLSTVQLLLRKLFDISEVECSRMDRGLGKPLELLVTHVTKHHGLVKIFGQTDLKAGHVRL